MVSICSTSLWIGFMSTPNFIVHDGTYYNPAVGKKPRSSELRVMDYQKK